MPDNADPLTPWQRLVLIPAKLQAKGFGWFARRTREETARIANLLSLQISKIRRLLLCHIFRTQLSRGTLFAIYDLEYYPISYDICWFLVWADIERRRRRLQRLQCVFIPCRNEAKRKYPEGYDAVIDSQSRAWRFQNICVPVAALMPDSGITINNDRSLATGLEMLAKLRVPTADSPPPLSTIYRQTIAGLKAQGRDWRGLSASVQGRRYVAQWLKAEIGNRKPVVITLRQYGVDVERNSALEEWAAFACTLDPKIYCPVIVPDTDNSLARLPEFAGLPHFLPASWNVGLRMAIYEMAYMNMFVNSGPGSLCILNNKCRYLFFKVTTSTYLSSQEMLQQMGFERGTSPGFATPFQKWVWEPDDRAILHREFNTMAACIDAADLTSNGDVDDGSCPRRDRSAA